MVNVEEICAIIAQKLLQGSMVHQQFINYYNFLGLEGYQKCHEYHYYEQAKGYLQFVEYYMNHYNKFIPKHSLESLSSPTLIPDNWYDYSKDDVDINTRRNAIKSGLERWISWEKEVKNFLQEMFMQLINSNEVALSLKIKQYIKDVDQELEKAELKYLQVKASDYDMPMIISQQKEVKQKYEKKICKCKIHEKEKGEHHAQFT